MLDINFNESWNELDKLNEDDSKKVINEELVNLFNDENRIWYEEMTEYFNRVYFNDEKKRHSLLPEETDAEGWDTLRNMREIEESILRWRKNIDTGEWEKMPSGGLARVCWFYNTYVIETRSPWKDGVELLNKDDHLWFHKGKGTDDPDLIMTNTNATADVKFKNSEHLSDIIKEQRSHSADFIVIYNYYDDMLYLYKLIDDKDRLYKKMSATKIAKIKDRLIPPDIYEQDIYSDWDEIFSLKLEEGIDPTTKFDKPWDLDKIPDQDFIDAGLDKKDYIDQAWAAWRNKKLGNVEYASKAASNETVRKKAEDDYNYALKKLGAVRRFPNRYGRGSYDAPEGVFDLDNFHVAFDKWFEDHGLMKLFDKEGKLKMKGSWGDISKLDKNEAPAKALIDLWRAQYSGGKTFKSAWDAEQQKKQAEEQAAKVRKDWEDQEDKDAKDLEEEIKKAILNSADWINLKKVYASTSKEAASKLDVDVEVWTRGYQEDQTKIQDSRVVKIWFKNMIGPDTDQFEALCTPKVDPLKISDSVDVIVKQLNSALTDLADAYYYLAELGSSWIAFTRSKTYEALGDNWSVIMFFNPADKKFYKITKKRVVSVSKDRSNSWSYNNTKSSYDDIPYLLLTYDIDGETRNYDVDYDISWEPVYACVKSSSDGNGNYMHWESSEAEYVFNLKYGTDILDKAGMRFYKPISNQIEDCEVENAAAPYNIAFEKASKYSYFLDSSD